jgi:hypothetical protein
MPISNGETMPRTRPTPMTAAVPMPRMDRHAERAPISTINTQRTATTQQARLDSRLCKHQRRSRQNPCGHPGTGDDEGVNERSL